MEPIPINRCINKETKFYGLKLIGLIVAGFLMMLIWIKFNLTAAILSASIGYGLGSMLSSYWHKGILQKWSYWHVPTELIANRLPKSRDRNFL